MKTKIKWIPRGSRSAATKHLRWIVGCRTDVIARVVCVEKEKIYRGLRIKPGFYVAVRVCRDADSGMNHPNPYRYSQKELAS